MAKETTVQCVCVWNIGGRRAGEKASFPRSVAERMEEAGMVRIMRVIPGELPPDEEAVSLAEPIDSAAAESDSDETGAEPEAVKPARKYPGRTRGR